MPDELNDWAAWVTIVSLIVFLPLTIFSILVSIGFFVRRNRTLKELIYIEQERDNIQKTAAAIEKRLKLVIANLEHRLEIVDPDRFLVRVRALTDEAKFAEAEKLAIDFTGDLTPAFGLAAEILAEQCILASGALGKSASDDALRHHHG